MGNIDLDKLHELLEAGKDIKTIREAFGNPQMSQLKLAIYNVSVAKNKLYTPTGVERRPPRTNVVALRKQGINISPGKVAEWPMDTEFTVDSRPSEKRIILTEVVEEGDED